MLKANFIPSFIDMAQKKLYEKMKDSNEINMFFQAKFLIEEMVTDECAKISDSGTALK